MNTYLHNSAHLFDFVENINIIYTKLDLVVEIVKSTQDAIDQFYIDKKYIALLKKLSRI